MADDAKPLSGRTVLVTRPREQAAGMVSRLESLGARTVELPVIAIEPPDNWSAVAATIDRLPEFDWLVFTSANGVRMLFDWMVETDRGLDSVWHVKVAAIGPATATELERYGIQTSLVAEDHRSEGLAAALSETARNASVLIARVEGGRELLIEELSRICRVDAVSVYRQRIVVDPVHLAFDRLRAGDIDTVTLTSANIARAFLKSLDHETVGRVRDGSIRLASISPVTSAAIRKEGYDVAIEAREHTSEGLIAAVIASARET